MEKEKMYWLLHSILDVIAEPFLEDDDIKEEFLTIQKKLEGLISVDFWKEKGFKKADILEIAMFIFFFK